MPSTDVPQFSRTVQSVVKRIGHVFRHPELPICKLYSLPLEGRLAALRLQGRRCDSVSEPKHRAWELLSNLGINADFPVRGWPGVRISTGFVARWGDPWFEAVRDGGLGWSFQRNDKEGVNERTQFLLDFLSSPVQRMRALVDDLLPLEDG